MIALDILNSSSDLFKMYLSGGKFIDTFFPANNNVFENPEYLKKIAINRYREQTIKCISDSMNKVELTAKQIENLKFLSSDNSLAVVSGQQIGFLGGPLYTFYKAVDAIIWADKFKEKYPEYDFVPIFWVEDNDHDLEEAAAASIYNKNNELSNFRCFNEYNKNSRQIVGTLRFDDSISEIVNQIIEQLPHSQFTEEIIELIRDVYKSGELLTDSFIKLLNTFLADKGLLFISANRAVEMGLFANTAKFEIENVGKSYKSIDIMNHKLDEFGLHKQAKHSMINLFFHINNERHKINFDLDSNKFRILDNEYTKNELLNLVEKNPENFSPGALLRPIFQDTILPTVAYIAGAGEIAYSSQITELYDLFGINRGAVINRHHIVVLTSKVERSLNKYQLEPAYFFKQVSEIEKELIDSIKDQHIIEVLNNAKSEISRTMDNVRNIAVTIDTNLESTSTAVLHNMLKQFDTIEKKLNSALKRTNDEIVTKYNELHNWLYPYNIMQERVLSLASLIILLGIKSTKNFDNQINTINVKELAFVRQNELA